MILRKKYFSGKGYGSCFYLGYERTTRMFSKRLNSLVICLMVLFPLSLCAPAFGKQGIELSQGLKLLEQGRRELDVSALKKADAIFTGRIQADPGDWQNHYYRSRVNLYLYSYYSEVKRDPVASVSALNKALADAQSAQKLNPRSADVYALLGRIHQLQMGINPVGTVISAAISEVPALEEYRKALELDPNNVEAEMGLGTYYLFAPRFLGGDRDRAIKHLKRAARLDPRNIEVWTWLSVALREDGDLDKARESLNTALALDPDSRFAKAEDKRLKQLEKKN